MAQRLTAMRLSTGHRYWEWFVRGVNNMRLESVKVVGILHRCPCLGKRAGVLQRK